MNLPTPPSQRSDSPSAADRLAAIEALDDAIICLDADLRITSWNQTAVDLHDVSAADAIGTPLLQHVAPESRMEVAKWLDRAMAGERVSRANTVFLRRDGSGVPMSIAVGRIDNGGSPGQGVVILGRDIAAQQRLQMQLLQSKRMEGTGHLAGGVAHEFNNILTAILALTDFAAREIPPDASSRDDLEEIRQQATKGARLVRHLLAFSRRQLRRTEVVQLHSILEELEPLLQRLVSERVFLAIDADADVRAVEIDRAQMELVVLELVSNATDAMTEGGTLTVGIRPASTRAENTKSGKAAEYVELSIQDSGIGVDPAIQPRLNEPFFTTKGEGHTGLGLAMVESVVHQHGGTVSIESTPGAGTTVRVLLPATGAAVTTDHAYMPATNTNGGSETILVVEDETAVRNIICRSLRNRGYHVIEAKNGEDALLVAEKHNAPIHLVVTDVVMPQMGGADLFHHLRRWYPTMRVLFISGYTKGAIPPEALDEGNGTGFLPKPFTLDQLAGEVRRVIQSPRDKAVGALR